MGSLIRSISNEITFFMQSGLIRDLVTVDVNKFNVTTLKYLACDFIDENFADHKINRLNERLLLFRHDYSSDNILLPINSESEVTNGTIVEIIFINDMATDNKLTDRQKNHSLVVHSYKTPHFCDYCGELLFGLIRQGLKCRLCGLNCHKKCAYKIPRNCYELRSSGDSKSRCSTTELIRRQISVNQNMASNNTSIIEVPHTFLIHSYTRPTVCQHCSKLLKGLFKQGVKCRDCKLNAHKKCISKIPLNCCGVDEAISDISEESEDNFFVKNDSDDELEKLSERSEVSESSEQLDTLDKTSIPLMRIMQNVDISNQSVKCSQHLKNDNLNADDCNIEINFPYKINKDKVLGSGHFGTVYAGTNTKLGHIVAIKVIEKSKFISMDETKLKDEMQTLQNMNFPGIIKLEMMFDSAERIFVAMERLNGDMLDMIIYSEKERLSEPITKFLTYQILVAVKYLHSRDICHCDLKPENILLCDSNTEYPQIKLCDFGYERIIGKNSFSQSIVRTPAYLAPEILYNYSCYKSLDMWSMGVVIYVTLSGTFPFNDDEYISDQIKNAVFMYPPNPWREVSHKAIDLISNLLQVNTEKRFTVEQCLAHEWYKDFQVWAKLRELEDRVGTRWLTQQSNDAYWLQYRNQNQVSEVNQIINLISDKMNNDNHNQNDFNAKNYDNNNQKNGEKGGLWTLMNL